MVIDSTTWMIIGTIGGAMAVYLIALKFFPGGVDAQTAADISESINYLQEDMGGVDIGALGKKDLSKDEDALWNSIGHFFPVPTKEKLELLNKAGLRSPNAFAKKSIDQFMGGIVGALAGFLIGYFALNNILYGVGLAILLGALFFLGAWSDLEKKIKQRSLLIEKTMPDFIDLFANACAAGTSFDMAMDIILAQIKPTPSTKPIIEDFGGWQSDVRMGMTREDAWKTLIQRSNSKNMKYFASLLDQSEKSGGSAADSLFKMAGFFRERRKQQLEAEIASLPQKMNMLTMMFIVGPMLLLLVIPIVITLGKSFQGLSM